MIFISSHIDIKMINDIDPIVSKNGTRFENDFKENHFDIFYFWFSQKMIFLIFSKWFIYIYIYIYIYQFSSFKKKYITISFNEFISKKILVDNFHDAQNKYISLFIIFQKRFKRLIFMKTSDNISMKFFYNKFIQNHQIDEDKRFDFN